ncbi:MAG: hypothetical protein HY719_00675 [Planctomycetes bacterium]|nr:hypothetical protein [Planctomycetota bacterium]
MPRRAALLLFLVFGLATHALARAQEPGAPQAGPGAPAAPAGEPAIRAAPEIPGDPAAGPPTGGAPRAAAPGAATRTREITVAIQEPEPPTFFSALLAFFSVGNIALPLAAFVLLAGCPTPRAYLMVLLLFIGAAIAGSAFGGMTEGDSTFLHYLPGGLLLLVAIRNFLTPPDQPPMRRAVPGVAVGLLTGLLFGMRYAVYTDADRWRTAALPPTPALLALAVGCLLAGAAGGVVPLLAGLHPAALRRSLRPVSVLGVVAAVAWFVARLTADAAGAG